MPKARNMIINGYRKGVQLQMDEWGIFYIFNGRNPLSASCIESHEVLTEETSKDVVSTVGRGLIGSSLFGFSGASASLTGKENKIYTIRIKWDDYGIPNKDKRGWSVLELDQNFYKMFMLKSVRTEETHKRIMNARIPSKYDYDYDVWLKHNGVQDIEPECLPYWEALGDNPETNPILDCCRSINPKWEEYMKRQEQPYQKQTEKTASDTSDIKSKLRQLKSMYEEDLITEEEYNSKKQELLSQI